MKRKCWPLLTLIGLMIVAGGVFLFRNVTILHLENMDHWWAVRILISPSDPFSIFYTHSIYKEPVTEEFVVEGGSIVLKGVRTMSPAVMEYYGFEDTKEFHPMNQKLGAVLLLKRGMGEEQGLIVQGRKIYLSESGERGDRIQLRIESMLLGKYLLSQFM